MDGSIEKSKGLIDVSGGNVSVKGTLTETRIAPKLKLAFRLVKRENNSK